MTTAPPVAPSRGAQGTVRRVIVFLVLFVLVIQTANGLGGLLSQLLETRPEIVDASSLAFPLASTLIGGPLTLVLWWFAWRGLDGPDRASVAWGLYLAATSTVSLVGMTISLLGAASDAVAGRFVSSSVGYGIAWALVWVLHRLMQGSRTKSPLRLSQVAVVLGSAYGLIVMAAGAIRVLESLFGAAILPGGPSVGQPWWGTALQALVWMAGGALVWWWHWIRERGSDVRDVFSDVVAVGVGIAAAAVVGLGGLARSLWVGLRALFDRDEGWAAVLAPLPLALAAALIGLLVWRWQRGLVAGRSDTARVAARLSEAGIGLVGAAAGIGVVINAVLATFTTQLAGSDARSLLFGGLATLVVGVPVWWAAWQPMGASAERGTPARRVYLVVVFGVSAVVAIIALITVGYRIFELVLGGTGDGFVERIRAPFGLLCATALVAGYHFAVWRGERAAAPVRTIDRITLVAAGDVDPLVTSLREATGAAVTVLHRADGVQSPATADVLAAVQGVAARRILVVPTAAGGVEVVPLAD